VHAYGVPRIIENAGAVLQMLRALVDDNERAAASNWTIEALPEPYLRRMLGGIVAFEIPIARLEAKAKVSQNRPAADRARVAATFERSADPALREMAELVRGGGLMPRG
ncbi:MAG: FMN-binding negative transcriptional regulator, partial [Candidatus Velthaea sp.]